MSNYRLKILTPEKKIYDGDAISTTVECENGRITVLAGHAVMTAALVPGRLTVRTETAVLTGTAGLGILHVEKNTAAVMVHSFSWDTKEEDEVVIDAEAAGIVMQ